MSSGLFLIKGKINKNKLMIGLSNAKQLVIEVTEFGTLLHITATTPDDIKNAMYEFLKIEEVKELRVLEIRN